jgi:hypothetical protein
MLVFVDSDLETAPEKDASEKLSATGKRALKTPFSAKRPPVGGALSPPPHSTTLGLLGFNPP